MDSTPLSAVDGFDDAHGMRLALDQARAAQVAGEVPVGAVVVYQGQIIATGRNAPVTEHDPTAHAEVVALRAAAKHLGNYRLEGCTLYVTLEPCTMCSGAMLHARIKRVVYGARDAKTGAAGSVWNVFDQPLINHHTQVQQINDAGLVEACADLLSTFFHSRRQDQRAEKRLLQHPLRQDALRPPDSCWRDLPAQETPWMPHYVSHLPPLQGLRMHYWDEMDPATAQADSPVWVCLHSPEAWGYQYRHLMQWCLAQGHRVVVPDAIGSGKSDKPKKWVGAIKNGLDTNPQPESQLYTPAWHLEVLLAWLQTLQLRRIVVVAHGFSAGLAMALVDALCCYRGGLLPHQRIQVYGLLLLSPLGLPSQQKYPAHQRAQQALIALTNASAQHTRGWLRWWKNDVHGVDRGVRNQGGDALTTAEHPYGALPTHTATSHRLDASAQVAINAYKAPFPDAGHAAAIRGLGQWAAPIVRHDGMTSPEALCLEDLKTDLKTLVLHGACDPWCTREVALASLSHWGGKSSVVTVQGVGHHLLDHVSAWTSALPQPWGYGQD